MKTRLIRNTSFNILGAVVPLLLSIVTIPLIIKGFGIERYGIFAIAWVIVGYFRIFEFGLGKATTRFMANAWNENNKKSAAGFFWMSFFLNVLLGLLGGMLLAIIAPWVVESLLNIPSLLKEETIRALIFLAFAVPLVSTESLLVGALESQHRFGLINVVRVSADSVMKVVIIIVLLFAPRLDAVIAAMVILRLISFCIYMVLCMKKIPEIRMYAVFQRNLLRPLLGFGGWLTITSIIGPLMTYIDRLIIGSLSSMRAVAYYTVPSDVMRKFQILPLSLGRTLFPIFSAVDTKKPKGENIRLYEQSIKFLTILMIPAVVCVIVLAQNLLGLWLGYEFAANSTIVIQILTLGMLINAIAKVPYSLIQGFGRPDVTAKFHMLELPIYLFMLFTLIDWLGIAGVAIAWTLRVCIDTLLLRLYAPRLLKDSSGSVYRNVFTITDLTALLTIGMAWFISGLDIIGWKLLATTALMITFALWSWYRLLENEERFYLRSHFFHIFSKAFCKD